MTTRKLFFLLPVLLCLPPFLSVAGERPVTINFWPLFHYTSDPEEGVNEMEGFGPFFYWREQPDQKQWGIRPLLSWTGEDVDSLWRLEFLYPFGKYQVKEGDKKGYLFPISKYRDQIFDGERKWDFQFFPFFAGETEKGEDYFGLFPFFGTLLERYGKDEIRFYLWPVYSESTTEGVRTKNFLWPFFSFIEGEKRSGYRVWPIYGKTEEFGVSEKKFLLWPIFVRQTKGLDTEDPISEQMIFPFYISKESKHFKAKTYLWPLFSHAREQTTGFEQWDLLWPLFRTFRGENLYGMRIFILYGYKVREGGSKRVFILYPFYQYEEHWIGDVQEKTYSIFFSRIQRSKDDRGMRKERSLRIWPLFDYERKETGHETFSIFYLLPFKEEGLERNLFPIFRIFRWEKNPGGRISANFLWGLYKRDKKVEWDYWEIAHLVGVKKGGGWKTVSFLKGLLLYEREGETSGLRFFYLPFTLRWSHHHPDPSSRKGEDRELFPRIKVPATHPSPSRGEGEGEKEFADGR